MYHVLKRKGYRNSLEVQVAPDAVLQPIAQRAFALIKRWGMVAAREEGFDKQGHSNQRLLTEEEVVERAFKTSELFHQEAEKRGLILKIPLPKPPDDETPEKE